MTQNEAPTVTIHHLASRLSIADRTMYAITAKYFAAHGTTLPLRRRRGRLTTELTQDQADEIVEGFHLAKARGLSYDEVFRSSAEGQKIPERPPGMADLVMGMELLDARMKEVLAELS